jgi:glutamate-1-semialdehyde 2,1-aminomutase
MTTSSEWFTRAKKAIPGGVHSPVRAFASVPGDPVFFSAGRGPKITDVEGREYLDFCMSWGPLILGHAHPEVVRAVQDAAALGLSFGACHGAEVELAETIVEAFDWADQARLVSSGTEAVMTALRLARGVTGRPLVVKFDGGYHGHSDSLLVKAGSGLVTQPIASSAGVPASIAEATVVLPFDDDQALADLFATAGDRIAAVVIEPMPANNGLLIQRPEFLRLLRSTCDAAGALLIFDEVISGFRLGYGGYGERVSVTPDLVTLGKIIGGGMPIGALVGRRAAMEHLAPLGPVYQAGTLSGNPVSVAAGLATLKLLRVPGRYAALDALGARLEAGVEALGLAEMQVGRLGSIVWLYCSSAAYPRRADAIDSAIGERFGGVHRGLLDRGFYLPPSAYEVLFLSAAHRAEDIDLLVAAIGELAR